MSDMYTTDPPEVDQKLIDAAILIGTNGIQAYWNALFGHQTPAQEAYCKRASEPRPGDLVVEHSSFGIRLKLNDHSEICVGTLVERKSEWVDWEFETEEEKEGLSPEELRYREDAWYIKLWVNPEDSLPTRWTMQRLLQFPAR